MRIVSPTLRMKASKHWRLSVPSLCCFWDPKREYAHDRQLTDQCRSCGRTYGHPLTHPPESIREYTIIDTIARGFYGAIYVAESGGLRRKSVLKVIPQRVYESFGKDFRSECKSHQQLAQGTRHLVDILDMFDADVWFKNEQESLPCHVAVLEHVDGVRLSDYLEQSPSSKPLTATAIAQIAVDLFRLLAELEAKQQFHNDLHGGNVLIRALPNDQKRGAAIEPSVIAVAVDLGSITDASRSHEDQQVGDLHQVTHHILALSNHLLANPDNASDIDYRLAATLSDIAHMLRPESVNLRTPDFRSLIDLIHSAFEVASSPWKEPSGLGSFNESYNAQTLRSWYVPRLLVDPEGWQKQICVAGPQVITGMRGCGKTMLLRSLQFHSRASAIQRSNPGEGTNEKLTLSNEGYLGLYISCTRLLDRLGSPDAELHEPYARLYIAYAREALRALRHLREFGSDPSVISPHAHALIWDAITSYIDNVDLAETESELALERRLLRMQISLEKGESTHTLLAHPTVAFQLLADAILACSPLWQMARVFFLLDDVSTRHLHQKSIRNLVSTLMFSAEKCAFKVTTEAQTLELVLKSPGLVEKARSGRDYDTFDLGAKINARLRQESGGAQNGFIARVLQARAAQYTSHPPLSPARLLGDTPLADIALAIIDSSATAARRKAIYHGLRALSALCVGDIGDVISIYDLIITNAGRITTFPIDAKIQSTSFQEYCSRRLYHLNRRKGELKDFALGFAEAAHELLMQSSRTVDRDGKIRLRQYSSVYVRVTSGDQSTQLDKLRELMDAGVFVLEDGPDAPRAKTKDSNPTTQFVLTYRKLFGLSNFIGLSQRDRFELSGDQLEEWLTSPTRTKDILLRNLSVASSADSRAAIDDDYVLKLPEPRITSSSRTPQNLPMTLFEQTDIEDTATTTPKRQLPSRLPHVRSLNAADLKQLNIRGAILGRGFETRTTESAVRLSRLLANIESTIVAYDIAPVTSSFDEAVAHMSSRSSSVHYDPTASHSPLPEGPVVVDVTGLAKPAIFNCIRQLVRRDGKVIIAHTDAAVHYPLNEDIETILHAQDSGDDYRLLEILKDLLTGETRPYQFDKLLPSETDEGRRRVLLAASSPKHERLLSLVEERDYDRVDVVASTADTPRGRLSRLAANVGLREYHSSGVELLDSHDLSGMLDYVSNQYRTYYVDGNYDVELGLTGSKIHAVACAIASSSLKFAQAWYVRPASFDPDRFTSGTGLSHYFVVESNRPS
ncbi:protein kinase [Mycolicibacterium septicum]|uniref:ORC-CDC6 family AAA ATPase n=1 Tax=Mycolicibacterium septicum TaxID=98668 RepID=UPI0023E2287C|nr:protein kinase [Mycolicibacterium septicum]MDF3337905.1 protein kinase [Mycolicibacterium septicum]